jgi:tripartite ATP-independent transporter DctM subunit
MTAALIGFAILLAISFVGLPLGFSMMAVGVAGFAAFRSLDAALNMASQQVVSVVTNYDLSVLPMFLLMGAFIERANLSRELYDACQSWFGHRRGGLAISTIAACGVFAAVCGSSVATAATMGRLSIPEMRRHGYSDALASGSVAAGGTLGIMIPPSVPMVLYGILTQADIGKLFIAGIVPGLLLMGLFITTVSIMTRFTFAAAPAGGQTPSWAERFRILGKVWGIVLLFAVVLGSIYFGVCTPSEAAAIGASGALVFALVRRRMDLPSFHLALVDAGVTSAGLFFILIGALVFANFLTLSGLPFALTNTVQEYQLSAQSAVLLFSAILLLLGCVFESLGMLFLMVPVFFPILSSLGVDPIWLGILVVIMLELGQITPPIGINVFVVKSVVPDVPIVVIFRGAAPFVAACIVAFFLIFLFPQIALWLPGLM